MTRPAKTGRVPRELPAAIIVMPEAPVPAFAATGPGDDEPVQTKPHAGA